MSTLGQLIDNVRHSLEGFGRREGNLASLASTIDSDDLSITLLGADRSVGRQLIEIDMELISVKEMDATAGVATVWPFGRGYRSTTAAAHTEGAEVRIQPAWPASTVAKAINETIHEIYPKVYSVVIEESEFPTDEGAIDLTGDPVGVIAVFVEDLGATDRWIREDRWDFNKNRSDNGKTLHVGGHYEPGRVVRVVYAERPAAFNLAGALSQEFTTVTGLEARHEALITLGVAYRLAPYVDIARLPSLAAEARAEGERQQSGSSAARLLYTLFQSRLEQEAGVLAKENPIRLHKVR